MWRRLNGVGPNLASAPGSTLGPDLGRGRAAASKLAPHKPEGAAKSKLPLALGLAAVLAVVGWAGWYYGIEQPAQRRLAEQQRQEEARRVEVARQEKARQEAEQARLDAARLEAEQARKAAEERAAQAARERDKQARLAAEAAAQAERERQAAAAAKAEQERLAAAQAAAKQASRAFTERDQTASNASVSAGQPITIPGLNLELVPISAGSFTMGSNRGSPREQPMHRVRITREFWLGKTEVTQAQWESIMGSNPSEFKGADRPVENVSYDDALEFCRKLTVRERAAGRLPSGYEYTLPTEAQWEYACRAGTTTDYAGNLDSMGWFGDNSGKQTHPVGQKRANAWGLFEMHGNVREWCSDWMGDYIEGESTDPIGDTSGVCRVVRGGSWFDDATDCRSACRSPLKPDARISGLGFRVALGAAR